MPRKARTRISYVLPLASSPGGHRLGVNGLAIDKDLSILYTAGRDGIICAWDLGLDLREPVGSPHPLPTSPPAKPPPSTFRAQVQPHTHWVNDIVLSNDGQALISCSSDLAVKIWRPHSSSQDGAVDILGRHTDYVKCLARPRNGDSGWVASGGLDKKIMIWDLSGKGEVRQIDVGEDGGNPKGSVYAIGVGGENGNVLASGGPESVVRIWDSRTKERVTKFVGHTDNVRSILVSDDGQLVLTASSDTTVKLWSLGERRVLHTLNMHNDSVWSLFSEHPRLELFHSSDRSGLIAKTDLRNTVDIDDGVCVAVCQEHEGVTKVIGAGDYIWTATSSSSINRWNDADTTDVEIASPPAAAQGRDGRSSSLTQRARPNVGSPPTSSSISGKKTQIPPGAILRLSATSPLAINVRDPDAVTLYSISSARRNSIADSQFDGIDPSLITPVHPTPEETITGHHGLTKHAILNDRRHVLTLDTAGEVVMWDLLRCTPVKSFGKKDLDDVAYALTTEESVANWCQVNTRTGALTVTLEEHIAFDAEMYADQLESEEKIEFREDQRINLGKWVLRYLFSSLIDEEIRRDEAYRTQLEATHKSREASRRANAPPQIQLPPNSLSDSTGSPLSPSSGSAATPRANGMHVYPQTPNMQIGLATPGFPSLEAMGGLPVNGNSAGTGTAATGGLNVHGDEGSDASASGSGTGRSSMQKARSSFDRSSIRDYFTSHGQKHTAAPVDDSTAPDTPAIPQTPMTPSTPGPESSSGFFGKMRSSFKKGHRSMSTDANAKTPTTPVPPLPGTSTDPDSTTTGATGTSTPTTTTANNPSTPANHETDTTFASVLHRIRQTYDTHLSLSHSSPHHTHSTPHLRSGILPSLPSETPVLKPPPQTTIIISEDSPQTSAGAADLYRGTVASVGRDADLLERVAPAWLAEVLLCNKIPFKEAVKISFVLIPAPVAHGQGQGQGQGGEGSEGALDVKLGPLPAISQGPEGNTRLNANRMLRARKIAAYIAERLPSTYHPKPISSRPSSSSSSSALATTTEAQPPPPPSAAASTIPPEEWLELTCQTRVLEPLMTLASIRGNVWRSGGDVVIQYRRRESKEGKWRFEEVKTAGSEDGLAGGVKGEGEVGEERRGSEGEVF